MNRKAFYHLLKRYVENDCTEEERKLVEQWYELLGDEEGVDPTLPPAEIKETLEKELSEKFGASPMKAPISALITQAWKDLIVEES